jgi:hypothetical protein
MATTNVSCFNQTPPNGTFTISINSPVPAPGMGAARIWILIRNSSGTVIPNLGTPTTGNAIGTGTPPDPNAIGFQSNGIFTWGELGPDTYTVIIWDANGECAKTTEFTIIEPESITISTDVSIAKCTGNATVIVEAAGGVPPYKYFIRSNETDGAPWETYFSNSTGIFTNIPVRPASDTGANRKYHVYVQDANGCWYQENAVTPNIQNTTNPGYTVDVEYPVSLKFILSKTDPSCFGICDGEIGVVVSGFGSAPYKFILTGNKADGSPFAASNDCDDDNCQTSYTFKNLCASDANGYKIEVYDADGCKAVPNGSDTVVLAGGTELTGVVTANNAVSCSECCDGSIQISNIGGGCGGDYTVGIVQAPEGQIIPTPLIYAGEGPHTWEAELLKPGNYTVRIEDGCGCYKEFKVGILKTPGIQIN